MAGIEMRQVPNECEGAKNYFLRMQRLDEKIARIYAEHHPQVRDAYNRDKQDMKPFKPGDKVWVLRPAPMGRNKMETWWLGPAKVTCRVGNTSYKVTLKP